MNARNFGFIFVFFFFFFCLEGWRIFAAVVWSDIQFLGTSIQLSFAARYRSMTYCVLQGTSIGASLAR